MVRDVRPSGGSWRPNAPARFYPMVRIEGGGGGWCQFVTESAGTSPRPYAVVRGSEQAALYRRGKPRDITRGE